MDLSRRILLNLSLQDLHPLLESLSKSLGAWIVDRHGVGAEGHLNVEMATIDPHTVAQPRSGQTRSRKALIVQQN